MDYDRTHQSHLESKYKAQKQNGTFLSFHPLFKYPFHDGRKCRHIQIKFQMKHEIAVDYVQLITKTFPYK